MTKKENEYYPQGGVHLKHAAIPRNLIHIASGAVPLTIHTTRPRNVTNITIHGNTINEAAVGDKTSNMFNTSDCDIRSLSCAGANSTWRYDSSNTFISSAQISLLPSTRYALFIYNADYSASDAIWCDRIIEANSSKTCTVNHAMYSKGLKYKKYVFTTNSATSYGVFRFASVNGRILTNSDISALKIMLLKTNSYSGNTEFSQSYNMPEYIPYGYEIPLEISYLSNTISSTIYLSQPIYSGMLYSVDAEYLPVLLPGDTTINVSTSVPPLRINVSYTKA